MTDPTLRERIEAVDDWMAEVTAMLGILLNDAGRGDTVMDKLHDAKLFLAALSARLAAVEAQKAELLRATEAGFDRLATRLAAVEQGAQRQLCPVCFGRTVVWYPPNAPMGLSFPSSSTGPWPCAICGGTGLLSPLPLLGDAEQRHEERREARRAVGSLPNNPQPAASPPSAGEAIADPDNFEFRAQAGGGEEDDLPASAMTGNASATVPPTPDDFDIMAALKNCLEYSSPDVGEGPRVERWAVIGTEGTATVTLDTNEDVARLKAARWNDAKEFDYPHRVVRLVEMREGESVVRDNELSDLEATNYALRQRVAEAEAKLRTARCGTSDQSGVQCELSADHAGPHEFCVDQWQQRAEELARKNSVLAQQLQRMDRDYLVTMREERDAARAQLAALTAVEDKGEVGSPERDLRVIASRIAADLDRSRDGQLPGWITRWCVRRLVEIADELSSSAALTAGGVEGTVEHGHLSTTTGKPCRYIRVETDWPVGTRVLVTTAARPHPPSPA